MEIGSDILSKGSDWIHEWESEGLRERRWTSACNTQVRSRLSPSDTRGYDAHLCVPRRRLQALLITLKQSVLTFSWGATKVVALQLKWLTKKVWNNLSDVFAPAGFFFSFFHFFLTAAIDSEQCRGHIQRIKYWPKWRHSQLESQPDTDISGSHFAETARGRQFIPSSEHWGNNTKRARLLINVRKNWFCFFVCFWRSSSKNSVRF